MKRHQRRKLKHGEIMIIKIRPLDVFVTIPNLTVEDVDK